MAIVNKGHSELQHSAFFVCLVDRADSIPSHPQNGHGFNVSVIVTPPRKADQL